MPMRPDADRCDVGQDAVLHYNKMLEARGAENYVVHYHLLYIILFCNENVALCQNALC